MAKLAQLTFERCKIIYTQSVIQNTWIINDPVPIFHADISCRFCPSTVNLFPTREAQLAGNAISLGFLFPEQEIKWNDKSHQRSELLRKSWITTWILLRPSYIISRARRFIFCSAINSPCFCTFLSDRTPNYLNLVPVNNTPSHCLSANKNVKTSIKFDRENFALSSPRYFIQSIYYYVYHTTYDDWKR